MATTNLFTHPAFKDGAFTSNDRRGASAIGKAMRAIDPGARLGAEIYDSGVAARASMCGAAKDPRDCAGAYHEAINTLAEYVVEQGYELRFAIEPKPNEPRGDIFLPTVGHALPSSHPERPDGRRQPGGRPRDDGWPFPFTTRLAGALGGKKLFPSTSMRSGSGYDQDFRWAEDLKEAFLLVRLLTSSRL
jgi:xylose isomerase